MRWHWPLAAAIGVGLFLESGPAAGAMDSPACRPVRLADVGWTDVTATTALVSRLLRDLGGALNAELPVARDALRADRPDHLFDDLSDVERVLEAVLRPAA